MNEVASFYESYAVRLFLLILPWILMAHMGKCGHHYYNLLFSLASTYVLQNHFIVVIIGISM